MIKYKNKINMKHRSDIMDFRKQGFTLVDLIIALLVFIDKIYNSSGFPGPRGAVEEEVGKPIVLNNIIENDFIQWV